VMLSAHRLLRATDVDQPAWSSFVLPLLAGGVGVAYIARACRVAHRGDWLTAVSGLVAMIAGCGSPTSGSIARRSS